MSDETDLIVESLETIVDLLAKDAQALKLKTTNEQLQRAAPA